MAGKKKKPKDDDELLDQCIKENSQCFFESCTKSIKVIQMQCTLCRHIFCTTHQLPEAHGCGQAARKAASKPGPKPALDAKKTTELHGKMSKKLDQMKNERKKK